MPLTGSRIAMRFSIVFVAFILVHGLFAYIALRNPCATQKYRIRMKDTPEAKVKTADSMNAIFPKQTKRYRSLPFSLIFEGPKKVIMRRRPPTQIHRGLRQLTLGADGLVHPREDYYEKMLLSSNGLDLDRLGLDAWYFLEATDPKVPMTLIPANTTMPDGLCLVHKWCREYCIETDRVCTLEEFNKRLKTLSPSLVEMSQTEFIKLNGDYWENMSNLPPVKSKGLYQYYDDC